ncbi:hypothetical protein I4F81_007047 [Pyropia yezoensis]|uniref:Uncharacterized protein n=1 Tax=Pyropia yezoensis TaxID=2788 RepID=A0ACC3C443_PYRYE|nr:hypothetical protein I4F81_007047 [Neopyropia yezoensis]
MASSASAGAGRSALALPDLVVRSASAAPDGRGAPVRSGILVRRQGASGQRTAPSAGHPAAVSLRNLVHVRRTRSTESWEPIQTSALPALLTDTWNGPSAEELNGLDGANPKLTAMLVAEMRHYRKLTDNPDLTNEQRDYEHKRLCVEATHREVGRVEPVSAWLTSTQGDLSDPLLGVVRTLPPPPPAGVPKADYLYAFAAAAAPHAGNWLSLAWLKAHVGRAVANGARVFQSPSSSTYCLSSALVQWGSTLYVGIAGRRWDDWDRLLKFFSSSLVSVDIETLLGGPSAVPASLTQSVAVNADAWAACRDLHSVLVAVTKALTSRQADDKNADDALAPSPKKASRVVFCGHGAAAAVATLLALQYPQHVAGDTTLLAASLSVATFGCPLMGDAALATALRARLPRTTRRYVDHDPVAGLPRWSAVGLRFSPAARDVAPADCRAHRVLSPDGEARPGAAGAPRVASLAVAKVGYHSHHRLEAYALCLTRQWAGRGVSSDPPVRAADRGMLHRLWSRVVHEPPQLVKGWASVGGGAPHDPAHVKHDYVPRGGVEEPTVGDRRGGRSPGVLPPTMPSSAGPRPFRSPVTQAPRPR